MTKKPEAPEKTSNVSNVSQPRGGGPVPEAGRFESGDHSVTYYLIQEHGTGDKWSHVSIILVGPGNTKDYY